MNNKLQQQTAPVRLGEKVGFGTFSAASNIIFYFKDLFFLTNVPGIRMADAGLIITAGISHWIGSSPSVHQKKKDTRMGILLFLVETGGLEPSTSCV